MALVFAAEGLDGSEKLLLLAYTNYTDAHGYCWPGEDRLADDTGTSPSTVRRTKKRLIGKNLVKSVRRAETSNLTRVNLPLLASMVRQRKAYDDNEMEQLSFSAPSSGISETGSDQQTGQSDLYHSQGSDLRTVQSDLDHRSDCSDGEVNLTCGRGQSDLQSISDPSVEPSEISQGSDGRRPATSGSRGSRSGGSAASGKTKPPSLTPEQNRQVDSFFKALPEELAVLVPANPPGNLKAAVLEALAADRPEGRTAQQLVEYRLLPKWRKYYASRDQVGPLDRPVGVLIWMLRRDAECGDARCDERTNVDSGASCRSCEMRAVDRRADRGREAEDGSRESDRLARVVIPPQASQLPGRERCMCGNPYFPSPEVDDDRCSECRGAARLSVAAVVDGTAARGAAAARGAMADKAERPRR